MKNFIKWSILVLAVVTACQSGEVEEPIIPPTPETMYFPPLTGSTWETVSPLSLQWNIAGEQDLFNYLEDKGTKSFIILKKGRIVYEKYFNGQTANDNWLWFSAAKTLTATTIGIAQQEGLMDIHNKSSDYLGTGWTALSATQEDAITIKHQLSMSSGLDETIDWGCYDPSCFVYKADPNTRWAYHQGAYTILQNAVTNATGQSFEDYFADKIRNPIGMDGDWFVFGDYHLYRSTARSMARFGLFILNEGVWDGNTIITDTNYFSEMTNTSQNINESYGYLWWLNGKNLSMTTGEQTIFSGYLVPNAPADMYCALGYADQKIYVVPSQELVIIRMGDDTGESNLANSGFDNILWGKINAVIN